MNGGRPDVSRTMPSWDLMFVHLGYKYCNGRMQKQKHTGWPPGVVGWPLGYRTAPLRVPCGSFAMSWVEKKSAGHRKIINAR